MSDLAECVHRFAEHLIIRADIRRRSIDRRSVAEARPDRLANQLDNAAALLMFQSARIKDLEACIELSEDIDAIYDILPKPSTI